MRRARGHWKVTLIRCRDPKDANLVVSEDAERALKSDLEAELDGVGAGSLDHLRHILLEENRETIATLDKEGAELRRLDQAKKAEEIEQRAQELEEKAARLRATMPAPKPQ